MVYVTNCDKNDRIYMWSTKSLKLENLLYTYTNNLFL